MAASERLAALLASRLSRILPASLTVDAVGTVVSVSDGPREFGSSAASSIVDESDDRSFAEKVETAAIAVLSGVQDGVAEALQQEWPRLPMGGMVLPAVTVEGDELLAWFGERDAPVVRLEPIAMTALKTADA